MPVTRIADFDTWRPGYGLATVQVFRANTSVLATIYLDEELEDEAANPQTLLERVVGGISYGKFAQPLYADVPFELQINSIDSTGIIRPHVTTLDGQGASLALVTPDGATEATTLEELFSRWIDVRDYGDFATVGSPGASASTNNATIVAAIGAAAAEGGGFVRLPPGTYAYTNFTIAQGVVLVGHGRVATTLQSTFAGATVTIGGARAGLSRLTIDGSTLVATSIGLYAANKNEIVLDDAEIKRFETGIDRRGGNFCNWRELYISNCATNYKLWGDAASGAGGAVGFNTWKGGECELASSVGVDLKYVDAACANNTFEGIAFLDSTGKAVQITGARRTTFRDCKWDGNTHNMHILDGTPSTANNTVIGLEVVGGSMQDGTLNWTGNLESVAVRQVDFQTVAVTLTTPLHNVLIEDCREISGVTFSGVPTAWVRHKTPDRGSSSGLTTGNTPTKAWSIALKSGQRVQLEGKVIGRGRNVVDDCRFHIASFAERGHATLAYDNQTANFTAGETLTGATSGATARICADTDAGTTGTLQLQDVVGTFQDNEIVTDSLTGSATANGTQTEGATRLAGGTFTVTIATPGVFTQNEHTLEPQDRIVPFTTGALPTGLTAGTAYYVIATDIAEDTFKVSATKGGSAVDTSGAQSGTHTLGVIKTLSPDASTDSGFNAYFVANGPEIELRVVGATSKTIEWTVDVDVVST